MNQTSHLTLTLFKEIRSGVKPRLLYSKPIDGQIRFILGCNTRHEYINCKVSCFGRLFGFCKSPWISYTALIRTFKLPIFRFYNIWLLPIHKDHSRLPLHTTILKDSLLYYFHLQTDCLAHVHLSADRSDQSSNQCRCVMWWTQRIL